MEYHKFVYFVAYYNWCRIALGIMNNIVFYINNHKTIFIWA
jgi:hypothetical protein